MDLARIRIHSPRGGWADYPAGASFGPRVIEDFEWVWVVEGEVVWEQGGSEHPMPPGSVVLVRPGMRDGFRWDPRRRTRHGFIHCQIEDPDGQLGDPADWPLVVRPQGENVLLPLLRHAALRLERSHPADRAQLQHSLQLAVATFVRRDFALAGQLGGVDEHPVLARALAALRERWKDGRLVPLTLGELAAAAGVSPGHLTRVFNAELGTSPQDAQRIIRLERAATMLTRSNMQVQAVAEQCGFACPFHFSRLFKKTYGASPRALRKAVLAGGNRPVSPLVRQLQTLV